MVEFKQRSHAEGIVTVDEFDESEASGPIVLDLDHYFELDLNDEFFEVTIEVRDQLANLQLKGEATPSREHNEAIFRAIMTTVANLELRLVHARSYAVSTRTQLANLQNNTLEVYSRLLNLETRILRAGLSLEDPRHESMDWRFDEEG